jgi:hypothetical protein
MFLQAGVPMEELQQAPSWHPLPHHRPTHRSQYPLLNGEDDWLVHQTNTSRGTNPKGKFLSEGMFRKYPNANCYMNKSNTGFAPGDIQVVRVNERQRVVNLFGQRHHSSASRNEPQQLRERWFKMGLEKLERAIQGPCTVGFPNKGGHYNNMVRAFANNVRTKGVRVHVYPYSGHGRREIY